MPLGLVLWKKLFHHSAISSTHSGASIWCSCRLSSSLLNSCWSAYAVYLGGTWYGFTSSLTCKGKVLLKHPVPKYITTFIKHFQCRVHTHCSVGFCAKTCNKVVYFLFSFVVGFQIIFTAIVLFRLSLFCSFINLASFCWWILVWQFMLSCCSHSQFGIHSYTVPFPGTAEKWYWYTMPALLIVTLHMPICGMHELLKVCNIIFFVYGFVYLIYIGIWKWYFLSFDGNCIATTTVSVLHLYASVLWLYFVFSFTHISDLMLWNMGKNLYMCKLLKFYWVLCKQNSFYLQDKLSWSYCPASLGLMGWSCCLSFYMF